MIGITVEKMKELAKKLNINANLYEYDKTKIIYDIQDQSSNINDENLIFPTLLYFKNKKTHIIYIINAKTLTNIHIRTYCDSYNVHELIIQ